MAIKVTLDTNCFFDYFERDPTHMQAVIDPQAQGHIEIAMTTRVEADTVDKWKGQGTSPIWMKIQSFPIMEIVGSAFRLGTSRLDKEDFLTSVLDGKKIERLQEIMRGAQVADIDHIYGHIAAKRDIFITSDTHFLDHRKELKNEFGVTVATPEKALQLINKRLSQKP